MSTKRARSPGWRTAAVILLGALAFIAAACGGEETVVTVKVVETVIVEKVVAGETVKVVETVIVEKVVAGETVKVVETVIVEKQVPGETVIQTVIVEKQVPGERVVETVLVEKPITQIVELVQTVVVEKMVAVPISRPAGGSSGSVTLVSDWVGSPSGYPGRCPTGCYEILDFSGWMEGMLRQDNQGNLFPFLATAWELTPDISKLTFHLREGVQFHKGWGEFSAEDFKYTIDTANSVINLDSTHGQSSGLATTFGDTGVRIVDRYTVELDIKQPTVDVISSRWVSYGHGMTMFSKRVFDELGLDQAKETFVGTGSYQNQAWRAEDRMVMRSFGDHWRKVPAIEEVRAIYVPEAQSQVAMFLTGEAHILKVPAQFIPELAAAGGVVSKTGQRNYEWWFTQNYIDLWDPVKEEAVTDIPAYERAKGVTPYVADHDAPGCNYDVYLTKLPEGPVCDEIENARLVRIAMSLVIDRQGMVDTIMGGYGYPAYVNRLDSNYSVLHREEWEWAFDPDRARELMAQAGVPDGFEHNLWIGQNSPVRQELAYAVIGAWEEELGIVSNLDLTDYGRKKDEWAIRDVDSMAMTISTTDGGARDNMPKGYSNWTRPWLGGANPFSRITTGLMQEEYDPAKRLQMAADWFEHYAYWAWGGAAVTEIGLRVNSPKLVWESPYSTWIAWAWWYPLEELTWK